METPSKCSRQLPSNKERIESLEIQVLKQEIKLVRFYRIVQTFYINLKIVFT